MSAAERARVDGALAAVGASEIAGRRMSRLSGGQQQRAAIAQALVGGPELLLLDEPLANLDVRNQQEIVGVLGRIQADQRDGAPVTILVVAHDLNPLLSVLTGAVYLLDGHAHYGDHRRRRRRGAADPPLRHDGPGREDAPGRAVHEEPLMPVVAAVGYQSNWVDILQTSFMRHAFVGGTLVVVASGLLGYFVVVRQSAFAAHALAHVGFPGATAAILLGLPVTLGLAVFCIAGGLAIGYLGERVSSREIATGTVLAFATGLGVLFASLASKSSTTVTNVLFGNLLAISPSQITVFALFTAGMVVVMAVIARPLTFASVDAQVAAAKGVPVRALGVVFLLLLALVITMAVQVVGTLLLFALVVTPCATALLYSARPPVVAALGTAIGAAAVWIGLVLSAMFNLPPSFLIVSLACGAWGVSAIATRHRVAAPAADHGDHHHPVVTRVTA